VVLLKPVHGHSTSNNLFWHSHLDRPLENTPNGSENILQPLTTLVAYYLYGDMKNLKCNFFILKNTPHFYLPLELIFMKIEQTIMLLFTDEIKIVLFCCNFLYKRHLKSVPKTLSRVKKTWLIIIS